MVKRKPYPKYLPLFVKDIIDRNNGLGTFSYNKHKDRLIYIPIQPIYISTNFRLTVFTGIMRFRRHDLFETAISHVEFSYTANWFVD